MLTSLYITLQLLHFPSLEIIRFILYPIAFVPLSTSLGDQIGISPHREPYIGHDMIILTFQIGEQSLSNCFGNHEQPLHQARVIYFHRANKLQSHLCSGYAPAHPFTRALMHFFSLFVNPTYYEVQPKLIGPIKPKVKSSSNGPIL